MELEAARTRSQHQQRHLCFCCCRGLTRRAPEASQELACMKRGEMSGWGAGSAYRWCKLKPVDVWGGMDLDEHGPPSSQRACAPHQISTPLARAQAREVLIIWQASTASKHRKFEMMRGWGERTKDVGRRNGGREARSDGISYTRSWQRCDSSVKERHAMSEAPHTTPLPFPLRRSMRGGGSSWA